MTTEVGSTDESIPELVTLEPTTAAVVRGTVEADEITDFFDRSFSVLGEPCRLIQLIPQSFIVKMQFALQERAGEIDPVEDDGVDAEPASRVAGGDWLRESKLRLTVELGRARMASAEVVGLPPGSVVELNRQADEPVDLFVNGAPFARGRLLLVGGTDWAVRIESFHNSTSAEAGAPVQTAATAS